MRLTLRSQRQKLNGFDYLQVNSGFRTVTVDNIKINQKILTATFVKLCVLSSGLGFTCTKSRVFQLSVACTSGNLPFGEQNH